MAKRSGFKKRVVQNSAKTGTFTRKQARDAAKKAAAQRTKDSKAKSSA